MSFSYLITLARNASPMLKSGSESNTLVPLLVTGRKLPVFTLKQDVSCRQFIRLDSGSFIFDLFLFCLLVSYSFYVSYFGWCFIPSLYSWFLKFHDDVYYVGLLFCFVFIYCTWYLVCSFNLESPILQFCEITSNISLNFPSSVFLCSLFLEFLLVRDHVFCLVL